MSEIPGPLRRCLQVLSHEQMRSQCLRSPTQAADLLLSVNRARCNDSVGLVGVRSLIYLHASINTREVGILVGEIHCCVGNLPSF